MIDLLINYKADQEIQDFSGKIADLRVNNYANDDSSDEIPAQAQQVYSLASYQECDSLYLWLKKHKLEEIFPNLVKNGFSDLAGLIKKMNSENPLEEIDLLNLRIKKPGLRIRLIYKLKDECNRKSEVSTRIKPKKYQELKNWLEDSQMDGIYEKLSSQGFYFLDDLIYLEQQKRLNEVLSLVHLTNQEIFKLGVLVYKVESECGERSISSSRKYTERNGKIGDCGFCCAFKNIFN